MVDYGSDAEVQKLAFGAIDTSQDARTASARTIATAKINSILDLAVDIQTPSAAVNSVANLFAAGLILTGQMNVDAIREHPFVTEAMKILETLKGDVVTDAEWGKSFPVERFDAGFGFISHHGLETF
jgi:hypothetical protein